jgi:competence protein ComEC
MLVYRPNYLFDVSFQLSVAAVAGIVVWGVPMMRAMHSWSWLGSRLASSFVVGVVATLWTLPIISYSFGNMPIVGVMLTPFVLIFSYIVVIGGMFTLILPSGMAIPFAMAAEWAAEVQNRVVEWAASLPFASVEYAMPLMAVALMYVLYAAITAFYWAQNQKKVITLPRYDYD